MLLLQKHFRLLKNKKPWPCPQKDEASSTAGDTPCCKSIFPEFWEKQGHERWHGCHSHIKCSWRKDQSVLRRLSQVLKFSKVNSASFRHTVGPLTVAVAKTNKQRVEIQGTRPRRCEDHPLQQTDRSVCFKPHSGREGITKVLILSLIKMTTKNTLLQANCAVGLFTWLLYFPDYKALLFSYSLNPTS